MSNYTIADCQEALIRLGYDVGPDGADGEFGANTQNAVLKLQFKHGLQPTGRFDKPTLAILFPKPEGFAMDSILVNIKSAWASKLNWTLAAGVVFNILAFLGVMVPTDVKDAVLVVGNGVVLIAAWIIKTWFTTTISTASAKKLDP